MTAPVSSVVAGLSTSKLLGQIHRLQKIQKQNPPTSTEWQNASDELAPLFAEMKRRQDNGRVQYL